MTFPIQSTLSAIKAFENKMGVAANNIANSETEGFKKSRATLIEGPDKTVTTEITQPNTPPPVAAESTDVQSANKEPSDVDLAEEIPRTIVAQRGYEENLSTIKTLDDMSKSVIDIIK
jgi:flagellar hook protein FlgE